MELLNYYNVIMLETTFMCFQGAFSRGAQGAQRAQRADGASLPKENSEKEKEKEISEKKKLMKTLYDLLNDSTPPKGVPFPRISGPRQNENVCIVGAGPAGIDMALRLKDEGYSKITMFEKTSRVGGKSYDTKINGVYRPQGTIFLTAEYFDNFVKLAERYNVGDRKAIPSPWVRT